MGGGGGATHAQGNANLMQALNQSARERLVSCCIPTVGMSPTRSEQLAAEAALMQESSKPLGLRENSP